MENIKEQKEPVIKRSLTVHEQIAIAKVKQKSSVNSGPIFCTSETDGRQTLELALSENLEHQEAVDLLDSRIMEATGAANSIVGMKILTDVAKAIVPSKINAKEFGKQLNRIAQSMQALAPQDEYEGQLVAQLIVLHEHAMEWLRRSMDTERVNFANVYFNGASKLLTRHHETLEALLKYRRKGEQRVHVEHVHIHDGAQAIVGTITTGVG